MSQTDDPTTNQPSELQLLKDRAKIMGIQHSPNIGVDALKAKIEAKLSEGDTSEVKPEVDKEAVSDNGRMTPKKALTLTEDQVRNLPEKSRKQAIRHRIHAEEMRLIRCQIYNNNPHKSDLRGEIISVGNKYLGNVRKFIPFGEATENGYHIPNIIYKNLIRRKYQQVKAVKQNDGTEKIVTRLAPEYTVVVLDPLTEEELKELAAEQAASQRVSA